MKELITILLSLLTVALCLIPRRVQAAHTTPLFHAVREYRDATRYLAVVLPHHLALTGAQKQFVEHLVLAAENLCITASSPVDDAGFVHAWKVVRSRVLALPRVIPELRLLNHGHANSDWHDLVQRQEQFLLAFETLAIQIEFGSNLPYDRQPYNQFSHIANPGNVPLGTRDIADRHPGWDRYSNPTSPNSPRRHTTNSTPFTTSPLFFGACGISPTQDFMAASTEWRTRIPDFSPIQRQLKASEARDRTTTAGTSQTGNRSVRLQRIKLQSR